MTTIKDCRIPKLLKNNEKLVPNHACLAKPSYIGRIGDLVEGSGHRSIFTYVIAYAVLRTRFGAWVPSKTRFFNLLVRYFLGLEFAGTVSSSSAMSTA